MDFEAIKKLLMEKFNLGADFDFASLIKLVEGKLGKSIGEIADPNQIIGAVQKSGGIEGLGALLEGDGKPGLSIDDVKNPETLKKVGGMLGDILGNKD